MKFITAFFMAWGNFITLPCPYKKWDGGLKNMMLAFLPLTGAVIGSIWGLVIWSMRSIDAARPQGLAVPAPLAAVLEVFLLFALCGFMHLDGFMDCNDAILSRRPMEDKQRILKDSTVGAFAVVTLMFLLLIWYACMSVCWNKVPCVTFFMIPVLSRSLSGAAVMRHRPLGTSQYREDYRQPGKWKWHMMDGVLCAICVLPALALAYRQSFLRPSALMIIVMAMTAGIAGRYARKQLGGMSGDIAGYMICWSELAGILTLAVTAGN